MSEGNEEVPEPRQGAGRGRRRANYPRWKQQYDRERDADFG